MCRFEELRKKEMINISDGERLGFFYDVIIDVDSSKIEGLVLESGEKQFFIFGKRREIIIPWSSVKRIGDDVILVDFCLPQITEATKMNDTSAEKKAESLFDRIAKKF